MTSQDLLGRRASLRIRRVASPGAFLALDDDPAGDTLLLPAAEIPADARVGDRVAVFVYLDSEERAVATTHEPKLALGEVAFLEVTTVTEIGAFVDWGLGKELLVPFGQQSRRLHVGEWQPIGLYVDRSGRLAGTMYVSDMLDVMPRECKLDEEVIGEAWRNDPDIGLFVIVERAWVGLVPAWEPHQAGRGDAVRCRVAEILDDGRIVLSLRRHAHKELESDAANILAIVSLPGAPPVGDRSSPDEIRDRFGISKKAFKRAVGRLLKDGAIAIDDQGMLVVRPLR